LLHQRVANLAHCLRQFKVIVASIAEAHVLPVELSLAGLTKHVIATRTLLNRQATIRTNTSVHFEPCKITFQQFCGRFEARESLVQVLVMFELAFGVELAFSIFAK